MRDAAGGRWLEFTDPVEVIAAGSPGKVLPALERLYESVESGGLFAAGFVAYECGAALDQAVRARRAGKFPLLWFTLFRRCAAFHPPRARPRALWHPAWKNELSQEEYTRAVKVIKKLLASGETYQVNYTFRLRAGFDVDPFEYFWQVAAGAPPPYAAFLESGQFAACSFSPELFFRLDGQEIFSRPMKGTMPRGLGARDDRACSLALRHSAKNRAENIMIVDMVRNDLGKIAAPGSVRVPALCAVERYETVWQMTSTVRARTAASFAEILQALFPPASCTGAPKVRTAGIIAGLEKSPRRIYTGCIGYLAPGRKMQFNVAIRTVLVDKTAATAEYGVGGGIVWDSTPADEFDECALKAKVVCAPPRGHALFETMLWTPQRGFYLLDLHLARLKSSAGYFSFRFSEKNVRAVLESAARAFPPGPARIRLVLERDGRLKVESHRLLPDALKMLRVRPAKYPVDSGSVYLYHKTTCRQVYEKARACCPGYDEVILWNEKGAATEFCTGNLVVKHEGRWYTPPVSCGLLAGTFRAWLLRRGIVNERVIPLALLAQCEKIYFCNSVRKMRPVCLGRRRKPRAKGAA